MSLDPNSLLVALLTGCVGFVLFVYGKRQGRLPHMLAGVVLLAYPYFVDVAWVSALIGVAVVALLWGAVRLGA